VHTARVSRATEAKFSRPARSPDRLTSMDFVRGVAMILMAIDHVRVYSGVPAGGPTPGVFFTRWITHFSAPTFVFLAGSAAYLYGRKLCDPSALSTYLLKRGAWLILLELTVLRLAWTFNLDFAHYLLAGVIWMIGGCMIVMSALVRIPIAITATCGVAIMGLHNLLDPFSQRSSQLFGESGPNWFLKLLYFGGTVRLGLSGPPLVILYVLVPWIGVMMAGYSFGAVMEMPLARRRSICLKLGLVLTFAFVVLRAVDVYGDPRAWRKAAPTATVLARTVPGAQKRPTTSAPTASPGQAMPPVLAFLNTTKYPASLSFLLMTLGPMLLLLSIAERLQGRLVEIVSTYGRVPMFYYLLHIPLIHFAACVVSFIREGHVNTWLFANHPSAAGAAPPEYRWPLGLLYAIYFICVITLYFPCRWFSRLRATHRLPWLSFL
jgi:uncharacterized membrane protein